MATIDELREAFRRAADDEENMRRNDPAGLQAICPHHFRNDVCVWCEKERVMSESKEVPLSYELDGVIADYEHDYRFDDTSFETVQRVRDALAKMESAEPVAEVVEHVSYPDSFTGVSWLANPPAEGTKLYAHPQAASADAEDAALRNLVDAAKKGRPAGEVGWPSAMLFDPAHARELLDAIAAIDETRAKEAK